MKISGRPLRAQMRGAAYDSNDLQRPSKLNAPHPLKWSANVVGAAYLIHAERMKLMDVTRSCME